MSRIDEIRERVEKASKGPWDEFAGCVRCPNDEPPMVSGNMTMSASKRPVAECFWCYPEGVGEHNPHNENGINDAIFIANAREDIPYLLSVIDGLVGALAKIVSLDLVITKDDAIIRWHEEILPLATEALSKVKGGEDE